MLAMRMQRNGRKGRAFFRVIVQESRLSPKSGRVVAYVGTYDPHAKVVELDNEKVSFYLTNGTQPSDAVARLLRSQKIDMPAWVSIEDTQSRTIRNPEKLRKNQPAEEEATTTEEADKEVASPAEDKTEDTSKTESAKQDAKSDDKTTGEASEK